MAQVVRVRLRKPPRVFSFIARDIQLQREDSCVVRSDRGLEYGRCVATPEDASADEEERLKMTVVRRASDHDDTTYKQIQMDEGRAKDVCKQKIRERNLKMKLVECEYSFDRKKIIFYFTADERVDFRELVKDLAREFKARIELRHIQVRDEAKLVGGIGSCGRELCCTTWMREFLPISMKMAKRQNLSLNPSKISGQCGRLLCCLAYENDQYQKQRRAAQKRLPEPGASREEMEQNREKAVDSLKKSSLSDVFQESDENEGGEAVERRDTPEMTSTTSKSEADADAKPDDGETKQSSQGGGRRRRRGRRRGGKGKKSS